MKDKTFTMREAIETATKKFADEGMDAEQAKTQALIATTAFIYCKRYGKAEALSMLASTFMALDKMPEDDGGTDEH